MCVVLIVSVAVPKSSDFFYVPVDLFERFKW